MENCISHCITHTHTDVWYQVWRTPLRYAICDRLSRCVEQMMASSLAPGHAEKKDFAQENGEELQPHIHTHTSLGAGASVHTLGMGARRVLMRCGRVSETLSPCTLILYDASRGDAAHHGRLQTTVQLVHRAMCAGRLRIAGNATPIIPPSPPIPFYFYALLLLLL